MKYKFLFACLVISFLMFCPISFAELPYESPQDQYSGTVLSPDEFSQASITAQQDYVLSVDSDFTDPNQREVFRNLAKSQTFDATANRENLVKYFNTLENFNNKDDQGIYEKALVSDISILNKNKQSFEKFAASQAIDFKSAALEGDFSSFAQGIFKTSGLKSTSFSMGDIDILQKQGFGDFSVKGNGELSFKKPDSTITVENGKFTPGGELTLTEGLIRTDSYELSVPADCSSCQVVLHTDGSTTISGNDFLLPGNHVLVSGTLTIQDREHFIIEGNSEFRELSDLGTVDFKVAKQTDYFFGLDGGCAAIQGSCIERNQELAFLSVYARDDNIIAIAQQSTGLDRPVNILAVPIISDDSKVTFANQFGDQVVLSKNPSLLIGDQDGLPLTMSGFVDEDGEQCIDFIGSAKQMCGKDLGKLISQSAQNIMQLHQDKVLNNMVGLYYGDHSTYAWLQQPKSAGGDGFTKQQALLYSMLWSYAPAKELGTEQVFDEAKTMGAKLSTNAEVMAYMRTRVSTDSDGYYIIAADPSTSLAEAKQGRLQDTDFIAAPQRTSCISFCRDVLVDSLNKAGLTGEASMLNQVYTSSKASGIAMAKSLQAMGWDVIFAAPDTQNPSFQDFKGENIDGINKALTKNTYWGMPLDGKILNFNPSTEVAVEAPKKVVTNYDIANPTKQDMSSFTSLQNNQQVTGGFIVARYGVHTAILGRDDQGQLTVVENHWDESPTSPKVFGSTQLSKWDWGSYIIVLPPGSVKKNK